MGPSVLLKRIETELIFCDQLRKTRMKFMLMISWNLGKKILFGNSFLIIKTQNTFLILFKTLKSVLL